MENKSHKLWKKNYFKNQNKVHDDLKLNSIQNIEHFKFFLC